MSTKIYYGFRFRFQDFSRGVEFLRSRIWNGVMKLASEYDFVDSVTGSENFVRAYGDAGLHVFVDPDRGYTKYVYVIPYGLPRLIEKIGRLPRWIQDYAYWNNTDLPEGMSEKRWKVRGKTWDRVALDDSRWATNRMTMEILSNAPHCQVALMRFLQERKRKSKV